MRRAWMAGGLLATLSIITFAEGAAPAQDPGAHGVPGGGKQVYQRANCVGCHKWHGGGGGGYGGDALSLRKSELMRDQIIEVLRCGRPGTGMPYHQRGAYDGDGCYGMTRADVGKDMPIEGKVFLRPAEIEAVTDYVIANLQHHGEPTYADCEAFFGAGARTCNVYKSADAAPGAGGTE